MKNLKFYLLLGLSALFVLSACEKEEITEDPDPSVDVNPTIILSQTTLTVSAEGGVSSVAYQIEDPVDGATVSVDLSDVTWISDVEITDSNINFTVDANTESDSRTGTVIVSYPGADDVSLTMVQEAVEIQYDYNHDLVAFLGYIYEGFGNSGEDLFYIWLSDTGFTDDLSTIAGGCYYVFGLFVSQADGKSLPSGTYTYGVSAGGNMVLSSYYSSYLVEYGSYQDEVYFSDGSITVSVDGDTYTIEGTVTDTKGAVHRIYYTGSAKVHSYVLDDVEFEATAAAATYYIHSNNVMSVDVIFTTMTYNNDDGYYYPPGINLTLETYMPYDADGEITTGTYNVSTTGESMTIYPGQYSYVFNYETEYLYSYGVISSGTMTVTESGDGYYITCDLITTDGASVKCTYTGPLSVDGMPESSTSLPEDATINLEGAVAAVYDYKNSYGNGGRNWYIYIKPESGAGDGLILDINSTWGDTVPTETYTASSTTTPAVGEYLYGYRILNISGWEYGTWYVNYDDNNSMSYVAPIVSGDIKITYNSDETHTIELDCTDDGDNKVTGSWTGSLDNIVFSASSISSGKHSANSKATEMKDVQRESRMKIISSDESGNTVLKLMK